MRTVEEHQAHVGGLATRLPVERRRVDDPRIGSLAEGLSARVDVPAFDNSSMDGFAVVASDLAPGAVLEVVGDIPAGASEVPDVVPGTCARIMTGAPVPPGADAVLPVEQTDQPMGDAPLPARVTVSEPVAEGSFIRRRGDSLPAGTPALEAGLRWTPAVASAAVALGHGEVPAVRRPRVAVLSTGSELVAPGEPLGFGQIPDSNSQLLAGLAAQFGAEVVYVDRVGDDVDAFRAALQHALEADLVISSGGVSVGAFEVVRQVTGDDLEFTQVAMQPGKPQGSGLLEAPDGRRVVMLALPGNPVSAFVSSWLFVRPVVAVLGGWRSDLPARTVTAAEGWACPPGRRQYIPVRLDGSRVRPVHAKGSGSHLVTSLALADGLAVVQATTDEVRDGDEVTFFSTTAN